MVESTGRQGLDTGQRGTSSMAGADRPSSCGGRRLLYGRTDGT